MRQLISTFLLNRKVKSDDRKVHVHNLSSAKTALIVYVSNQNEEKVRKFARFLKEEGIKVETVGFYKKKSKEDQLPVDELGYVYFGKKDLSWLQFPTASNILELLKKEFDLLIDLNLTDNFSLQVISSLSKAQFKVGPAIGYQNEICDLTIAIQKQTIDDLIVQLKKYLQLINQQ